MSDVYIHIHKPKKDHECDSNGPPCWGNSEGKVTYDESEARKMGINWGSVTCSKCGSISYIEEGWD